MLALFNRWHSRTNYPELDVALRPASTRLFTPSGNSFGNSSHDKLERPAIAEALPRVIDDLCSQLVEVFETSSHFHVHVCKLFSGIFLRRRECNFCQAHTITAQISRSELSNKNGTTYIGEDPDPFGIDNYSRYSMYVTNDNEVYREVRCRLLGGKEGKVGDEINKREKKEK